MLSVFGSYLAAHFLAYAIFLRKTAALRTERGIFLYHFVSAVLVALAALWYAVGAPDVSQFGVAGLMLVLSVHGIYSLSFLELWSLAQGGYSLSVIGSIARAEADGVAPDFTGLEEIGEIKQRDRIAGLEKLGLIARSDCSIALTSRGRIAAALLHGLLKWIAPGEDAKESI
jgi:hypothetical protein